MVAALRSGHGPGAESLLESLLTAIAFRLHAAVDERHTLRPLTRRGAELAAESLRSHRVVGARMHESEGCERRRLGRWRRRGGIQLAREGVLPEPLLAALGNDPRGRGAAGEKGEPRGHGPEGAIRSSRSSVPFHLDLHTALGMGRAEMERIENPLLPAGAARRDSYLLPTRFFFDG